MQNPTTKELQDIIPKMREKGFYVSQKQRQIDWASYTANQINDVINTLYFIKTEVDKVYCPLKNNRVGRPPIDAGFLAKGILFIETLQITERKAEGWLSIMNRHLGFSQHLDDRVIGKAYTRKDVINILEKVFKNNIECDGQMCGDGSVIERTRKENYESDKKSKKKGKKKGLHLTSIVDSRERVLAFDVGGTQECRAMHFLVKEIVDIIQRDVNGLLKKAKLTLDSGFVDKKLAQLIEESGIIPYIFPKKNNVLKSKGHPAWKRMLLNLLEDVQAWLKEYHIRSHSESFHSSFKRIFGIITKKIDDATYTQILARVIHNNRRKTDYYNLANLP